MWPRYVNRYGYGTITKKFGGKAKTWQVHRLAWETAHGPIKADLTVDHLCFNKTCCNPAHMELVSLAENSRRGAVRRWGWDDEVCRQGHVGERARQPSGKSRCRGCEREYARRRRAQM